MKESLFRPRGIAIAGASRDPAKVGHQVLHNLLAVGYPGQIALVHPQASSILGVQAYPDLAAVPISVEMLILALPADTTPTMVEAIQRRRRERGDLKVVVALAGGFAETRTEEGERLQEMLADGCRTAGVRLLGPNCVGVIDHRNRLDTSFLSVMHRRPSGISVLSQSGSMAAWMAMEWGARPTPVGLNKFISLGNMADMSLPELVGDLSDDPTTRAIGIYLEGMSDVQPFLDAARRASRRKPVVVMKAGRTETGAQAALQHTGAPPGSDELYEQAFPANGLLRVRRVDDFVSTLTTFDRLPLPLGSRLAVLSNSGGAGVCTLDVLADQGVSLARFSPASLTMMRSVLPHFAVVGNPDGYVDMTGGVGPRQVAQAVATALRDPGVDAVFHLFMPTNFNDTEAMAEELLRLLPGLKRNSLEKPLFLVLLGGQSTAQARQLLEEHGMMTYSSPEQAAISFAAMARYAASRQLVRHV